MMESAREGEFEYLSMEREAGLLCVSFLDGVSKQILCGNGFCDRIL